MNWQWAISIINFSVETLLVIVTKTSINLPPKIFLKTKPNKFVLMLVKYLLTLLWSKGKQMVSVYKVYYRVPQDSDGSHNNSVTKEGENGCCLSVWCPIGDQVPIHVFFSSWENSKWCVDISLSSQRARGQVAHLESFWEPPLLHSSASWINLSKTFVCLFCNTRVRNDEDSSGMNGEAISLKGMESS